MKHTYGKNTQADIPIWGILDGARTPMPLSPIYILKDLWK